MAYQWVTWLADVLRDAGCPVVEEPGWQTRGRPGGSFTPRGIMLHHDASPPGSTSSGPDVIINGRPDLAGPLAQLWLSYTGTWHVCAAGRANHAGGGSWHDIPDDDANSHTIGIETDHTANEDWTGAQFDYGTRGLIALCDRLGIRTDAATLKDWLLAHKEWAPGRKVDPDPLDMDDLRGLILTGADDDEGLFGMSTLKGYSNSVPRTHRGNGDFQTIVIADGISTLIEAPKSAYHAVVGLTFNATEAADTVVTGDTVQFRLQAMVDYSDERPTVVAARYPTTEVQVNPSANYVNLSWLNSLKPADDGGRMVLRVFVRPPDGKTLTVSSVAVRVLYDD